MTEQDLCLCFHLQLTQLTTQTGNCLAQLGKVKAIITDLLLHAGTINTDLAGMVHHVIQQLGLHPDLLTANLPDPAAFCLDGYNRSNNFWPDWLGRLYNRRLYNLSIRWLFIFNCLGNGFFSVSLCCDLRYKLCIGTVIRLDDDIFRDIRFGFTAGFTDNFTAIFNFACLFTGNIISNVFTSSLNISDHQLFFNIDTRFSLGVFLLLVRHAMQRRFQYSCITWKTTRLDAFNHLGETVMRLMQQRKQFV